MFSRIGAHSEFNSGEISESIFCYKKHPRQYFLPFLCSIQTSPGEDRAIAQRVGPCTRLTRVWFLASHRVPEPSRHDSWVKRHEQPLSTAGYGPKNKQTSKPWRSEVPVSCPHPPPRRPGAEGSLLEKMLELHGIYPISPIIQTRM